MPLPPSIQAQRDADVLYYTVALAVAAQRAAGRKVSVIEVDESQPPGTMDTRLYPPHDEVLRGNAVGMEMYSLVISSVDWSTILKAKYVGEPRVVVNGVGFPTLEGTPARLAGSGKPAAAP